MAAAAEVAQALVQAEADRLAEIQQEQVLAAAVVAAAEAAAMAMANELLERQQQAQEEQLERQRQAQKEQERRQFEGIVLPGSQRRRAVGRSIDYAAMHSG